MSDIKKLLTMDKTPYYQKYKYRISKKFGLIFLLSSVVLLLFFISQLFYNSEPLRVFYVFYLSSGVLEFIWKTLIIICLIMICYGFVMLIKAFGKPNFVIVTDTYIQFPYPPLLPIKTIKFLYKDIQKLSCQTLGKERILTIKDTHQKGFLMTGFFEKPKYLDDIYDFLIDSIVKSDIKAMQTALFNNPNLSNKELQKLNRFLTLFD